MSEDSSSIICRKCEGVIEKDFIKVYVEKKPAIFHPDCFTCSQCDCALAGAKYFEKDGIFYCEKDYLENFGKKCGGCGEFLNNVPHVTALNKFWHSDCFKCEECGISIEGQCFKKELEDGPHGFCESCYWKLYPAHVCPKCNESIMDSEFFTALGERWHVDCLRCHECDKSLSEDRKPIPFHEHENHPYCGDCAIALVAEKCGVCGKPIVKEVVDLKDSVGFMLHPECLACVNCKKNLLGEEFVPHGNAMFCTPCLVSLDEDTLQKMIEDMSLTKEVEAIEEEELAQEEEAVPEEKEVQQDQEDITEELQEEAVAEEDIQVVEDTHIAEEAPEEAPEEEALEEIPVEEEPKVETPIISREPSTKSIHEEVVIETPVEPTPKPVEPTPKPVGRTPEPVKSTPKPVAKPAPVVKDPAPAPVSEPAAPEFPSFPLNALQNKPFPDGVDPTKRELYLSADDFETIFKMTKEEFSKLAMWKRVNQKKAHKLF